ncbi:MAG TPA: YciI family protein [Steroidobacteraceae bacterium]
MLYSILIYGDEGRVAAWTPQEEKEVMGRHANLRRQLTAAGQLGPVMRLSPEGTKIVRRYKDRQSITDGPYAETKEQLMGIYVIECQSIDDAIAATEQLTFDTGVFEIRPLVTLELGAVAAKIDPDCPRPPPARKAGA